MFLNLLLTTGSTAVSSGSQSTCTFWEVVDGFLTYLEEHSSVLGVVVAVIGALLFTRKFIKEKRAEAFCGFYAQLLFYVSGLKHQLISNDDFNITMKESTYGKNIFCLRYTKKLAESFLCFDSELLASKYATQAQAIKKLLLESSSNVYPSSAEKNDWFRAQQVLFNLCMVIEDESLHGQLNDAQNDSNQKPIHIREGEELSWAIEYIENSIYSSKF